MAVGTAAFTTSPALAAGLPMAWWRRRPTPCSQVPEPRCTRYLGVYVIKGMDSRALSLAIDRVTTSYD